MRIKIIDQFQGSATISDNVPVYADTSISSTLITLLNHDIVIEDNVSWRFGDWAKFHTMEGKTGFVRRQQIYSPTGYRAAFIKREGNWYMIYFIAGD